MGTMPVRVDNALFESARSSGQTMSRSAAQQLQHWARIGRELEAAPGISQSAVSEVLRGTASYDALPDPTQAVVRAVWAEEIDRLAGELDLAAEFAADGVEWVDAAPDGTVVRHGG